ncbi:MAG: NUDIX hydrolase [Clostridia bacterium]|nr:NUDIX hydrolase [Clostridia bacterium]
MKPDDNSLLESQVGSKTIYTTASYRFTLDEVILPNGQTRIREHLHHPGGVAILALDNEGRIPMVRQYRHPISEVTLEIPAGKLDKIPDETPEHAALRELREETGMIASHIESLGFIYPSPGVVDERLWLFFASGLLRAEQDLDDDEFIHVQWLPVKDLEQMISDGENNDAKAICALMRAKLLGKL